MTFLKRLRYYLVGVIIGSFFVVALFGKERFGCSAYLPNGRVLQELTSKKWVFDKNSISKLEEKKLDTLFIKDSLLKEAEINFKESIVRDTPCLKYELYYPSIKINKYHFTILKCKENVKILNIQ